MPRVKNTNLLLDDGDEDNGDSNGGLSFRVNRSYASKYEERKRGEELTLLKEKYGDSMNPDRIRGKFGRLAGGEGDGEAVGLGEDSESSTDEDEDEEGEEVTPEVDVQILRTIAAIRQRDQSVYQKDKNFFDGIPAKQFPSVYAMRGPIARVAKELERIRKENANKFKNRVGGATSKSKREKPLFLKDYHRQTLLAGQVPGAIEEEKVLDGSGAPLTHQEEQEQIKQQFKKLLNSKDDGSRDSDQTDNEDSEEDGADLFTVRQKTQEEMDAEERDYKEWLLSSLKSEENCQEAFKDWLAFQEKKRTDLDEKERFLMDYIFNRGWVEKEAPLPSYKEIVGEQEAEENHANGGQSLSGEIDEEEDLEEVEKADHFEKTYNFRFEELQATGQADHPETAITTHSRQISDTARRKDTRRSEQRKRRKEQKEAEKQKKIEELKRLKNLKKLEIRDKLKSIQECSGIGDEDKIAGFIESVDLDGDFDPDTWDSCMSKMFDDSQLPEDELGQKPKFDDDQEEEEVIAKLAESVGGGSKKKTSIHKKLHAKAKKVNVEAFGYDHGEEDDFCMDADYVPGAENYDAEEHEEDGEEQQPSSSSSKKSKKKGKKEDGGKKDLNEYLDEYFQMDYEDMIGDMPVRFKYRQVDADNFGLKPEEILLADDTDLNQYLSLKKLAPYRTSEKDREWLSRWRKGKKKRRVELRKKLEEENPTLLSKKETDGKKSKKRAHDDGKQEERHKKKKKTKAT